MRPAAFRLTFALALVATVAGNVSAQSSATLARDLGSAMKAGHMEACAARVPDTANEFVAALLYPGVQLLVVGARYPTPEALDPLLTQGKYRDIYAALQGSPIRDSNLFVQDMGVDGLRVEAAQSPDVVYQQVVHQTVLTGDVKTAGYRKEIDSVDPAYSRLLKILLEAVQGAPAAVDVAAAR